MGHIRMNPYAASYDAVSPTRRLVEVRRNCPCCRIDYLWAGLASKLTSEPAPCDHCVRHRLHDPANELEARREHDQHLVGLLTVARQSAATAHRNTEKVKEQLQGEIHTRAQATAAALHSRDRYREIVQAVKDEHSASKSNDKGPCTCGVEGCTIRTLISSIENDQHERDYDARRDHEPEWIRELFKAAEEGLRERWAGRYRVESTE